MAKKKTEPIEEVVENVTETVENTEDVVSECECGVAVATSSNFTYGFDESLVMEDVSERNLYVNSEITPEVFEHIYYFIMRYNTEDVGVPIEERKPIKLHISTVGGSEYSGLGICEIIRNSVTPVIGICASYALSMGFYIFISCNVRYATSNAFLLNHEGMDGDYGHPSKVKDYIKFSDKLKERLDKIIIRNTNLTQRDLDDTERIENYMFADEAKDIGAVDYIIGVDCSLEDIL